MLDAARKPFTEDIVEGTAAAVHGDLNVGGEQAGSGRIGRELRALVGVEDCGSASAEGLAQFNEIECAIQGVGQLPGEHIADVPVDDSVTEGQHNPSEWQRKLFSLQVQSASNSVYRSPIGRGGHNSLNSGCRFKRIDCLLTQERRDRRRSCTNNPG